MRRYRLTPPGGAPDLRGLPAEPPARGAHADRAGVPRRAGPRAARQPAARSRPRRAPPPGRGRHRAGAQRRPGPASRRTCCARSSPAWTARRRRCPSVARDTVTQQALANQGWAIPNPIIGDYGTDYTYRAGVAVIGLGANTPVESVYPTAFGDADGRPFDGASSYRLDVPARAAAAGAGVLVADDVRRGRLPRRQPAAPLRGGRQPSAAAAPARRLDRRSSCSARRRRRRASTGCRLRRAGSASTCACTCPSAACSTGAGGRRRSSASAEGLGRAAPRGRCPSRPRRAAARRSSSSAARPRARCCSKRRATAAVIVVWRQAWHSPQRTSAAR